MGNILRIARDARSRLGLAVIMVGLICLPAGTALAGSAAADRPEGPGGGQGFASRPVIESPAAGSRLCAGNVALAGQETNPVLASQQARAAWSYTPAHDTARPVRPVPVNDIAALGGYDGLWRAGAVPAGRGTLRLTLGYGEVQGTATRPVAIYGGPSLGQIKWEKTDSGRTVLSVPSDDPGGRITHWQWYFGDGHISKVSTHTALHTYARGRYVVAVTVTDDHDCRSTRYGELEVPSPGQAGELRPIDWCDPLGFRAVDQDWPASPQLGLPAGRFPLGRTTAGKMLIGYGFQIQFTVFGDPAHCYADQFIKAEHIEQNGTTTTFWQSGDARAMTNDDYAYDYDRRRTAPSSSGNGTSTITWMDEISIIKHDGDTNGQILFEVLDAIFGHEAKISHGDLETEPPAGERQAGESAYHWFKGCVTLKPPAGQKDFSYTPIAKEGPDAAYPAAASGAHGPALHEVPGGATITGC